MKDFFTRVGKWWRNTTNLSYIKKLIDADDNSDIKDFGAVLFYFVLAILSFYAMYKATTNDARLSILYAIIGFILVLLGIKEVKNMQHKLSDNRKEREIEVEKAKHNN